MPARTIWLSSALLLFGIASAPAQAEQYEVRTASGTKVVHTRVAPVVVHRLLPPFYGRHVYQGRAR